MSLARPPELTHDAVAAVARIGLILTPDNAADADFWRWCPPGVSLHIARNDDIGQEELDCVEASTIDASDRVVSRTARSLRPIGPALVMFACTSGSFVGGLSGERRIRTVIESAADTTALTTSGSVLDAIDSLSVRRLAVGTPYDQACTDRLGAFLQEAGVDVASLVNLQPRPGDGLSDLQPSDVFELARLADRPDADAIFLSCTGLATFDLIEAMEAEHGKPVLTATQATMWAATGFVGHHSASDARQRLMVRPWVASPRRMA